MRAANPLYPLRYIRSLDLAPLLSKPLPDFLATNPAKTEPGSNILVLYFTLLPSKTMALYPAL